MTSTVRIESGEPVKLRIRKEKKKTSSNEYWDTFHPIFPCVSDRQRTARPGRRDSEPESRRYAMPVIPKMSQYWQDFMPLARALTQYVKRIPCPPARPAGRRARAAGDWSRAP